MYMTFAPHRSFGNRWERLTPSLFLVVILLLLSTTNNVVKGQTPRQPNVRQVAHGLRIPWDLVWGPEESIWFTERGGKIRRYSLSDSSLRTLYEFKDSLFLQHESGLLGMALHPSFPDSSFVYVAASMRDVDDVPCLRILRFEYEHTADTLLRSHTIFTHKPVTDFHLGCRLGFLPDGTLLATMGDAPVFGLVQDDNSSYGKVIRIHSDGSIPVDNPVTGSPMYTKGHRNVQGLAILPNGTVFTGEHGNVIEDEINVLIKGRNYGWPWIEGPCDTPEELDSCAKYDMTNPLWSTGDYTIALSGLAYYGSDRYPELRNSLLSTTLKGAHLLQLTLNEGLDTVTYLTRHTSGVFGRLRDVLVSPDGRVFICTSNYDQSGYFPFPKEYDDRILELSFVEASGTAAVRFESDTLRFACRPNDIDTAFAYITNTSEIAYEILAVYQITPNAKHQPLEYRWPYTIYPGRTELVPFRYSPTSEGEDTTTIQFQFSNGHISVHNMLCLGTTKVGRITPISDTVHVVEDTTSTVLFINDGTDTIEVRDVIVSDSLQAEIIAVDGNKLAPGDTIRITIRYRDPNQDSVAIIVTVRTTADKSASAVVERVVVTSVMESTSSLSPYIRPVPLEGETFAVYGLPWDGTTTYSVVDITGRIHFSSSAESREGHVIGSIPYSTAVRGLCFLRLTGSDGQTVIIATPVAR